MSPPMKGFIGFRNDPGDQARRDFMAVQAGIGEKDLTLAEELAQGVGSKSPVTSHVRQIVKETILEVRSEEHTSELKSLMRISYAVFCLKKKKRQQNQRHIADEI